MTVPMYVPPEDIRAVALKLIDSWEASESSTNSQQFRTQNGSVAFPGGPIATVDGFYGANSAEERVERFEKWRKIAEKHDLDSLTIDLTELIGSILHHASAWCEAETVVDASGAEVLRGDRLVLDPIALNLEGNKVFKWQGCWLRSPTVDEVRSLIRNLDVVAVEPGGWQTGIALDLWRTVSIRFPPISGAQFMDYARTDRIRNEWMKQNS